MVEDEKNFEEKFDGKKLYESFYDILKYSNFRILKCYSLIFNKSIFKNNIGNFIIISIFSFYLVCLAFSIIKGIIPLKNQIIKFPLKNKEIDDNKSNKITNLNFNQMLNKNKIFSHPIKKHNTKNLYKDDTKRKNQKSKKSIPKINNFNKLSKPYFYNKQEQNKLNLSSKNKLEYFENKKNINKELVLIPEKQEENKVLLDAFELNELEYNEAISLDQRTFIQTYWDILCREHIIIFTFYICNDYNLLYI